MRKLFAAAALLSAGGALAAEAVLSGQGQTLLLRQFLRRGREGV